MYARGHILTGITTAAATAIITSNSQNYKEILLNTGICTISSLLTSQFADLDTPNSKISKRIPIMKILTSIISITLEFCMICVLICASQLSQKDFTDTGNTIFIILCSFLFIQIWLRQNLEHRGITHTLLFNSILSVIMIYPYFAIWHTRYYLFFVLGMISGLVSHLIYDTITVQGCPLFYPFSKKNIRLLKGLKIRSGKDDVYGVFFSCIILMCIAITKFSK